MRFIHVLVIITDLVIIYNSYHYNYMITPPRQ
jgi:hypothetical protein